VNRPSLARTIRHFQDRLVESIHQRCLNFRNERPAYCLAINYGDVPEDSCVPTVGLGLLLPGQQIPRPMLPLGEEQEVWWNPAEFQSFGHPALQPDDDDIQALDRVLAAAAAEGAAVEPRGLCRQIAARLDRCDWSGLNRAQDFLVYAVDDDLAHLATNLRFALKHHPSERP
jgi:hypothetical protein